VVVGEPIDAAVARDVPVARAGELVVAAQQLGAAALEQRDAAAVDVWPVTRRERPTITR
jgi:hypothetical protein